VAGRRVAYAALALAAAAAALAALYLVRQATGLVAVIRVEGYILTASDADRYARLIDSAYRNESVRAVVVVIDSFGGSANYVERVYYSLRQLRARKPVVALAVNALSGGYYIACAAGYIFAHPTSLVGSIGVIAVAPPLLVPSELVLETGPYKHTGFSRLHFFSNLSRALDAFISAVEEGRGQRLRASREELSKALVYLGSEALRLGLVDELGSLEQAVERAAREAGLLSYSVVELDPPGPAAGPRYTWRNVTVDLLESLQPPPAIYYIYMPAEQLRTSRAAPAGPATGGGRVLVDLSHGNLASWWSLYSLLTELSLRNVSVGFLDSWSASALANATCLIVAAPTRPYSESEVRDVEGFVRRGGVLLLLYDPAYEYLGEQALRSFIVGPINSLASRFGVVFSYGYLYSTSDYYGIYRNIRVRGFANSTLLRGVRELVLFTAAPIATRHPLAWANGTYSSAAEGPGNYTVAAMVRWGNGTVIALGDLTIFSEPYCRVADNYAFASNLASFIANASPAAGRAEGARIERPQLPPGTEKVFEAREDGEVYELRWLKVSESEVVVETPRSRTRYLLAGGRLAGWESDGVSCTYDEPLPEPPFPLTRGLSWNYTTGFTLVANGEVYRGWLAGRESVEEIEWVEALDGRRYLCARVRVEIEERLRVGGATVVSSTRGRYWISTEAGTVKESMMVESWYGGRRVRELVLKELKKPG